ncbi:hypothetical protein PMAYCL1PPCAC_13749, partial [Pristionchus mayeri]
QSMEIFLPLRVQNVLFTSQRVFFVITSLMSVLSMFCLLKKTPPNQTRVRAYLLYIQVLIIMSSIYLDILLTPIPIFPAIGGYCVRVLCTAGLRPHSLLGVFILIIVLIMTAVLSCSFYRHQSIIPASNPLRISEKAFSILQISLILVTCITRIVYAAYPFHKDDLVGLLISFSNKNLFILCPLIIL